MVTAYCSYCWIFAYLLEMDVKTKWSTGNSFATSILTVLKETCRLAVTLNKLLTRQDCLVKQQLV